MKNIFKLFLLIISLLVSFCVNPVEASSFVIINNTETNANYIRKLNNEAFIAEIVNNKNDIIVRNNKDSEIISVQTHNNCDYGFNKKTIFEEIFLQLCINPNKNISFHRISHKISPYLEHAICARAP